MDKKTIFGLNEILDIIPHRPPFLFVDRVIKFKPNKIIIAERTIRSDEPWFEGHFPQKAIMPGALVLDALAQTSGLLLGFTKKTTSDKENEPPKLFYLASSNVKFTSPAFPGETLELISESREKFENLYSYNVEATVGRKIVAKGILTLAAIEGEI
ncbi:MAG: 3-hydroxyacyl-ACP dehydratase FabZ [Candidatus Aceula meridiana]|nr:3-hydroxyacyl-ACP dehydratase FabZ [Candidatus Aceula meridiana]